MKRMDVVKRADGSWGAESGGNTVRGTKAPRKDDAVKQTAEAAKRAPEPVTVKIHKENGRIAEERTYPRKADPPGSPG
jgi:Uncharacterized protein conserved in bacteria (DUF2188)